jgi:hypothetical protein
MVLLVVIAVSASIIVLALTFRRQHLHRGPGPVFANVLSDQIRKLLQISTNTAATGPFTRREDVQRRTRFVPA